MSLVEINQGFRNVNKSKQGFVLENDFCMLFGCLVRWGNQQTERRFVVVGIFLFLFFFFVAFLGLPLDLTHCAIV